MELTETVFKKSNLVLEKALRDGKHLTREELKIKLEKAKIPTRDQRIVHLLFRAELDGLVCSGSVKDKKQTYALLRERVPKSKIVEQGRSPG